VVAGLAAHSAAFVALPLAAGVLAAATVLALAVGLRVSAAYLASAAVVATPAAVRYAALLSSPNFTDFALRFGLRMGPNPDSARVAGTWLTLGLILVVYRQARDHRRVLAPALATATAGCVLSMQSLVTGRDFQEFHYLYLPSMVMPPVIAAWGSRLLERAPRQISNRLAAGAALYVLATWLVAATLQYRATIAAMRRPDPRAAERNGQPVLAWLRANLEPGQTVIAPPNWSWSLVFQSGARPLVDYGAVATFVPDSVLFGRWIAQWKAYGLTKEEVKDSIAAAMVQQLPWWPFGFPRSGWRRLAGLTDFRPSQLQPLIRAWTDWYTVATPTVAVKPVAAVVPSGRRFRPEVVGWAAAETAFRSPDGAWLVLRPSHYLPLPSPAQRPAPGPPANPPRSGGS